MFAQYTVSVTNEPDFARIAALAGDPARAAMLAVLFDGRAIPAGELARAAGVAPATASAHLHKLAQGGLVRVRSQGRHRYYALASAQIASALEALGTLAQPVKINSLSESARMARLRFARCCYSHLAGELALIVAQALVAREAIVPEEDGFRLCADAGRVFASVGVDAGAVFRNPYAHVHTCIDWTQRRPHIAGPLGTALLEALLESGALRRQNEPRVLQLTQSGSALLRDALGVEVQPLTRRLRESA